MKCNLDSCVKATHHSRVNWKLLVWETECPGWLGHQGEACSIRWHPLASCSAQVFFYLEESSLREQPQTSSWLRGMGAWCACPFGEPMKWWSGWWQSSRSTSFPRTGWSLQIAGEWWQHLSGLDQLISLYKLTGNRTQNYINIQTKTYSKLYIYIYIY